MTNNVAYIPFTRSSKHRANIEQTSNKHRAKHQAGLMEPRPLAQM